MEIFISLCLGVGLSAATGFRIFVPALIANVAAMNGLISPSESFTWLASWPAFWVFLSATVVEVGAYYIPFVDNLLDTIATPLSVIAGTLLTTSFVEIEDPVLKWGLGLIVGGGTAGVVQAGTGLLRLFSSKTTVGLANPVVSTSENIASFSLSGFAVFVPIAAAVLVAIILYTMFRLVKKLKRRAEGGPSSGRNP